MSGRLLVVATPIGNLGDLSARGAEALRRASLVLAEDTRRTRPLLEHVGASGKLISCHQHNEEERVPVVVERLAAGEEVALVTDAGAPGVSDPGGRLVDAVVAAGFDVEVVPGPSAVIAAIMGAGLMCHRFWFAGFLPRKRGARKKLIARAPDDSAVVVFEAPARVKETLADLHEVLGERRVVVARELTKKFETFHRGTLGGELTPAMPDKGEVVIVVEAGERDVTSTVDEDALAAELMAREDLTPKQRAKELAKALGVPTAEAYARLEARKGEGTSAVPPADAAEATTRIQAATRASAAARRRLLAALADAARALLEADAAAVRALGARPHDELEPPVRSDIPGADALMAWLDQPPALPAPVEAHETARAILNAMAAADLLEDGIDAISGDDD